MLQHGGMGPKFVVLLGLLSVPVTAAGSSIVRAERTVGLDIQEVPGPSAPARSMNDLTRGALKALYTFELSPRERRRFYLHNSRDNNAGVQLPVSSPPPFVDWLEYQLPKDAYYVTARQAPTSGMPLAGASVTESRLSGIPLSIQWVALVAVGIPLAFVGGAIVLAALVVAVSLLSRGSWPVENITEESAFTVPRTSSPDKQTHARTQEREAR